LSNATKAVDNIVTPSSVSDTAGGELQAKSSDGQSKESAEGGFLLQHSSVAKRITDELSARFPHSIIEVRQSNEGSLAVFVDRVKVFDQEKTQQLLDSILIQRDGQDNM
jgi:hypothetical protein